MEYACLTFNEDGTPVSPDFDDVYFSQGQGVAESHHVFIEPNRLSSRFRELTEQAHFTIAETGFGTGLNFLIAASEFLKVAPATARMTFVSCENSPIHPNDLAQILRAWPEFSELVKPLLDQYPPALAGYHCLEFGRIELILMLGDATQTFSELTAQVDAWFLDGFTPSRNPDMWRPELFTQIARLSKPSATLATFTCARSVRDGLAAAGFRLRKRSGFGLKREMLAGDFVGFFGPVYPTGWPSSELPVPTAKLKGKRTAIVGAGIAGATTAFELSKRGFQVTVYEAQERPALGGSGNRQGAVYAKLSATLNTATQFYGQALILAQRRLAQCSSNVEHDVSGLAQLAHDAREIARLNELKHSTDIPTSIVEVLSASALSEKVGVNLNEGGAWFAKGGWVNPAQWVEEFLAQSRCQLKCNTIIASLTRNEEEWILKTSENETFRADHVVLTLATDALKIEQTSHLPLKPIAGQVSHIENSTASALKAVICTDRYIVPSVNGVSSIGSTFRLKSIDTEVTQEDHENNLASLTSRIPSLLDSKTRFKGGRAGVRCTTPDYLPLVGPISKPLKLAEQFRIPLQRNLAFKEKPAEQVRGLWVNLGHGSKGLCSSHLSAKMIATMMSGEPIPLQASLLKSLNPNRFLVRALLREKRKKLKNL